MQKSNKKIAIFTCHNDPNYGSMLQAYALVEAIRKLGIEAEYISYNTGNEPRTGVLRLLADIKHTLQNLMGKKKAVSEFDFFNSPEFKSTMDAFRRFHTSYIPCSQVEYYYNTIGSKLNINQYDNYIVGSDQSWSPNLYSVRKPYFLDIAEFSPKNAYAPSMGTTVFSDEYKKILKDKLSSFNHLSCREGVNSRMLSELLDKNVEHVLDPTLLLTPSDWNKIATQPKIQGEYVLAYILGEKDTVVSFAENVANKKGLPLYFIVTRPKYLSMQNALTGVGPDDFVGLIKNATCVITDSYHGCLFCINYNREFYAFSKRVGDMNQLDNIRILEMLNGIGLENRLLDDREAEMLPSIDFINVNCIINEKRDKSIAYLNKCLYENE